MPDFPFVPGVPPNSVISTFDYRVCNIADYYQYTHTSAAATAAWPAASRGLLIPIRVSKSVTVTKMMVFNGATLGGNVSVGIYDLNHVQLVESHAAQAGASAPQIFDITDTLLIPGHYFLGMASDSSTALYSRVVPAATMMAALDCEQMASAYPLPAVWTPAAPATAYLPYIGALVNGTIV